MASLESTLHKHLEAYGIHEEHTHSEQYFFGAINIAIKEYGLTEKDIGLMFGISPRVVFRWSAGLSRPKYHSRAAIIEQIYAQLSIDDGEAYKFS